MSFINDITAAVGIRYQAGSTNVLGQPAAGSVPTSTALNDRLNNVFQDTFTSSLTNVVERGASGEFDDPTLRLQEQAAKARLEAARQQGAAQTTGGGATATTPATPTGTTGSAAAPEPGTAPATTQPGGGASSTAGASEGASLLATSSQIAVAEQRELHRVRILQAEARVANLSASLQRDFPLGASLPSSVTGWDPETFVPTTREEAEAFAQRMVIDASEAAAQLELLTNRREAARLEASVSGSQAAQAEVAKLDELVARQQTYVGKLARIVDASSDGSLSSAGAAALAGTTARTEKDQSAQELAAQLRAAGADEITVEQVLGASEGAIEQVDKPEGSALLKESAAKTSEFTWTHRDNLRVARQREMFRIEQRRQEERQRSEERQREYDRQDEKALQKRQSEQRHTAERREARYVERRSEQQQANEQSQLKRAEFNRFLQQLSLQPQAS